MRKIMHLCEVLTLFFCGAVSCFIFFITVIMSSGHAVAAGCPVRSTAVGTVSFGTLTVPPSAAIGSLIDTRTISVGGSNILGINGEFSHNLTKFTTLSSLGAGIYDTNVPGIGIKVTHLANLVFPDSITYTGQGLTQPADYKVDLYKTSSNIQSGTITSGQIATVTCNGTNVYNSIVLNAINVVSTACTVNTASLTVPIGMVSASEFSAGIVGSTSHETPFTIPLNCPGPGVPVKMQLDGDTISGFSTALVLSDSGTNGVASGYGVQVLTGSSPVVIGTPTQVATTVSGQTDIQLKARYIKTSVVSTGGKANSAAVFTITYN